MAARRCRFQKVALLVLLLFWHLPRLLYDAAHVLEYLPLPPWRFSLAGLVIAEWVSVTELAAKHALYFAGTVLDHRSCMGRLWLSRW